MTLAEKRTRQMRMVAAVLAGEAPRTVAEREGLGVSSVYMSLAAAGCRVPAEDHFARMSAAQKSRTHTAETKARISVANKGQTRSAETKARMSAARVWQASMR